MHATVPTLDQESFAAFRAGDENALERLFRGHYSPLVVAASSELGDAPRAARVVERAVLSAWHARSEFRTPEALEAFIDKAANEHLVLEKGRIAAVHRFASFERVHAAPAHTTTAPTLESPHSPTSSSPSVATIMATWCQTGCPSVSVRSWTSAPPAFELLTRQKMPPP